MRIETADGGVVILLVAVAGYCLLDVERCGGGEPSALHKVQTTFESGVRRYQEGDRSGLQWVCLTAHQGYAQAQYFYGVYLFRRDEAYHARSRAWLERAGAQGHRAAAILLRQIGGPPHREAYRRGPVPAAVAPPALASCLDNDKVQAAGGVRPGGADAPWS